VKYIYADSMDHVDPGFNFLEDRNASGRNPYWDDAFPHEIMGYAPYDGVLVSRGIVGDHRVRGKYSEAQAMRFRRVGARKFLRLEAPKFARLSIFGDCGAFTYHKEKVPPYTPDDMAEFYHEGEFTHGCSVDHIIFDYDETVRGMDGGSQDARSRYEITLANAQAFLKVSKRHSGKFVPLGVIQGWSPGSMAEAARRLWKMGYRYLAVGGMVPLRTQQIMVAVTAIRDALPAAAQLHILGFAKADDIDSFAPLRITSFDTTSPLLRSFKDKKANYYLPGKGGKLQYYTAIRIPQALENNKLMRLVKQGAVRQEKLVDLERRALDHLRAYDRGRATLERALESVLAYGSLAELGAPVEALPGAASVGDLKTRYLRTLKDRPWKRCACAICKALSVEVIVFRGSNRNKRRGIHNMGVFHTHVASIEGGEYCDEHADLFSSAGKSKSKPQGSHLRCQGVGRPEVRRNRPHRAQRAGRT
jgi:hypothetical protein